MKPIWKKRIEETEKVEEILDVDFETGEILNGSENKPVKAEL